MCGGCAVKVKSTQVLELLQQGKTTREIADLYQVDIRSIQAHKYRLVRDGKYTENGKGKYCFDELDEAVDFLIDRLLESRHVSGLKDKIRQLERDNELLRNENNALQNKFKDDAERKLRYHQAIQSGDVAAPLLSS